MSAKVYHDKKAMPLVEKLKEVVKSLTIKCVQLAEQGKKPTAKVDRQQKQINRLTDKVMEQDDTISRLQEKVSDLGRLERYFGRERVQSIVEQSKAIEQAEKANKRAKRAFVRKLLSTQREYATIGCMFFALHYMYKSKCPCIILLRKEQCYGIDWNKNSDIAKK